MGGCQAGTIQALAHVLLQSGPTALSLLPTGAAWTRCVEEAGSGYRGSPSTGYDAGRPGCRGAEARGHRREPWAGSIGPPGGPNKQRGLTLRGPGRRWAWGQGRGDPETGPCPWPLPADQMLASVTGRQQARPQEQPAGVPHNLRTRPHSHTPSSTAAGEGHDEYLHDSQGAGHHPESDLGCCPPFPACGGHLKSLGHREATI